MSKTRKIISTSDRFHINLIGFIDLILEIIPEDYTGINWNLINLGKKYVESWTHKEKIETLESFIKRSEKYWSEQIKNREESFFIDHSTDIFSYFGKEVNVFKKMFLDEDVLTSEDKEIMWDYVDSFVRQSIKYIHERRIPKSVLHENKYQQAYSREFMKEIKLSKHSMLWGVELKWS